MDVEKLKLANFIHNEITELEKAIECFEYEDDNGKKHSLNARISIEYDGADGRETQKIPVLLNAGMMVFLKEFITDQLEDKRKQFEAL